MGAFGAAVRGGMSKVAFQYGGFNLSDVGGNAAEMFDALQPGGRFHGAYHANPAEFERALRSDLARQMREARTATHGIRSFARFSDPSSLGVGQPEMLSAQMARREHLLGEIARRRMLLGEVERLRGIPTVPGSGGMPVGASSSTNPMVGGLGRAIDREIFGQTYAQQQAAINRQFGGEDVSQLGRRLKVAPGQVSPAGPDPVAAEAARNAAAAARIQEAAKGALPTPAAAGGPGFFARNKGMILGGAGLLGGGLLLSHLMGKRDERRQPQMGPYGPVYA